MVVNIKTNAVEVQHELPAPRPDRHKDHSRPIPASCGTRHKNLPRFFSGDGSCVEYDKDFKEIWAYDIKSPWAALRLKNGNTLITDEKDVLTREVNPKKETVWELKTRRSAGGLSVHQYSERPPVWPTANTIVCSRGGDGKGPQLVEVTPDKKVVWVLKDWADFGPATAVQVLDDPGIPENPGQSQH